MAYAISTYKGDAEYCLNCTGDVVVGDEVRFERATFTGSYRNATFAGFQMVTGTVIRDSYGRDRQQHTFTLRLANGSEARVKGRNLYTNGVWRKPWADEARRREAQDEKHARGDTARTVRDARRAAREESGYAGV